jgi:phosphoribosylaminoimidazole-succinocarboxamide synthase
MCHGKTVRGYVTGTTSTSLWTVYNQGLRNYCGNPLRDGMRKNEKLEENILTPTTKSADHDLPVSGNEVCWPCMFAMHHLLEQIALHFVMHSLY